MTGKNKVITIQKNMGSPHWGMRILFDLSKCSNGRGLYCGRIRVF
jgi:hypothetical protein